MSAAKKAEHPRRRRVVWILCLGLVGAAAYFWLSEERVQSLQQFFIELRGRTVANDLELQIALARKGFSPGSIDGTIGGQTRQALEAFQTAKELSPSGRFDEATRKVLRISDPVYAQVLIEPKDFAAIDPPSSNWKERGTRPRMAYHSILEMVAERSQADPDLLRELNPALNFDNLKAGARILVPLINPPTHSQKADHLRISLHSRTLQAIDTKGTIIFHAPVSIARRVDKRPRGELAVKVKVEDPNYTFNPDILTATAEREGIRSKFIIQPGPNNPVGTIWIGLNLPSYGIHGTPEPEKVGRTESSGCFRLANWNAEKLIRLVEVGTPVHVRP